MKTETALRQLRSLAATLPPGERLPGQRALCAQLDISTFVLHQCLRKLEREGRVRVFAKRGIFASEPEPQIQRHLQVVFLDDPRTRIYEYGLTSVLRAASRRNLTCEVRHLDARALGELRALMQAAGNDPACLGVMLSGYVSREAAQLLETVPAPFVIFGDVYTPELWPALPVIAGDLVQAGSLAAETLIEQGCTRLVLVGYIEETDWPWLREFRAGMMTVLELYPDLRLLVSRASRSPPQDVVRLERELAGWFRTAPLGPVGVVLNNERSYHFVETIHRVLRSAGIETTLAMTGSSEIASRILPGIRKILFSMEDCAETVFRRLAAQRLGADSAGRCRLPFALLPEPPPPGAAHAADGTAPSAAPPAPKGT